MRQYLWTSAVVIGLATVGGCTPEPPKPVAPAKPAAAAPAAPAATAPAAATPAKVDIPATTAAPTTVDADSSAGKWGGITGRVVLGGELPTLDSLVNAGGANVKDAAVCAVKSIPDETVVVDPKSKGIANVVVYLRRKPETIHPSLEKSSAPTVLYDQIGCRFVPHVIVARTDQTMNVVSADAVAHNTRGTPIKNDGFNFLLAPVDRVGVNVPFKSAESLPTEIRCDIHPWMKGYWMIVDHPYATVTAADGTYSIPLLPPGEHEFRVWHERAGYLDKSLMVTVTAGQETEVQEISVTAERILEK